MKRFLFAVFLVLISTYAFSLNLSINEESIKAFREAQECYENQKYGEALSHCEDAILFRKKLVESHRKVLETSLASRRVQREGDEIRAVLKVLEERGEKESISIINYYFTKKGEDFFENSISKMLSYIEEIKVFPEAQILIGDVYLLEGEYDFAEQYYVQALNNANVLDVANQKYEIYIKLAQLSKLKKDYNQMEVRLLSVLKEDSLYKDKALYNSMLNTVKSDKENSMEKFFQLYRSDNYYTLEAYSKLFEYYYSIGETDKALQFSLLSVLTNFSRLEDIVSARDSEFTYTTLDDLLTQVSYYNDLLLWCNQNDVWKNFNSFAELLIQLKYMNFAKALLKTLSASIPENYWQQNAVLLYSKLQ